MALVNSPSCATITSNSKHFPHPQKGIPYPSIVPASLATTNLPSVSLDLPILEMSLETESYALWSLTSGFFLCSIMSSRPNHVPGLANLFIPASEYSFHLLPSVHMITCSSGFAQKRVNREKNVKYLRTFTSGAQKCCLLAFHFPAIFSMAKVSGLVPPR